ncbi:MAG: hypothetical protein MR904_00470 [Clostridia bacterium]|nr:hypothetical protein [Clostridia bacterium]
MKNIKKLLSQQGQEILPDNAIKDIIKQKIGFEEKQTSLVYAHNGQQKVDNVFKTKLFACSMALILLLIVGIFIPILLNKNANKNKIQIYNKFAQVTNAETFFAYSAASVGDLLSSPYTATNCSVIANAMSCGTYVTHTKESDLDSAQTEIIDKYMSLVVNLFGSSKIESNVAKGDINYQFAMNIHYTNLNGEVVFFKMLFNKLLLSEEKEEDEVEQNYSIDGILLKGNEKYLVEGLHKVETEKGESESEMYFKAFLNSEKNSYIEVQQNFEIENDAQENEIEQEFIYSLYNNGKVVEKNTIKYEAEDDELSLKMHIITENETNNLLFNYERIENKNALHVVGNIGDKSINYYIYFQKDGYQYSLGN